MKIFVAGATGVLGRRVVPKLLRKEYTVIGLSRSDDNDVWLRDIGAEPRRADLFDQEQVLKASSDCEVVLHLATAIPRSLRVSADAWRWNDRIRREGTQNLLAAAKAHKVRFYLQQSITAIYGNHDDRLVTEESKDIPASISVLQSATDMEMLVRDARNAGLPASILRFGSFCSADSDHTIQMIEGLRKNRIPLIGSAGAFMNWIHVDDAAEAVVAAVQHYGMASGKDYVVCDDEPVPSGEFYTSLAQMLGAKVPKRMPEFVARFLLSRNAMAYLKLSLRCSNAKFKTDIGWKPLYANYRAGFRQILKSLDIPLGPIWRDIHAIHE